MISTSVKLGDVLEIYRGGSPRPIENFITEDSDGLNWIKIGDVGIGEKYIEKTKDKIKKEGISKTRQVYAGDFLLSNSMSFGRPYITKIDGCIHDGWLTLRDTKKLFDKDFLYHLLSSQPVKAQFAKFASGAVVKNLNIDAVSKVTISIPPLAEQKRIAELLDTADRIIRLREQAIAKLDELTQSVFMEMFGEIKTTTKYERKRISTVSNVHTGKTPPTSDKENYADEVPFVTPTDLRGIIKTSTRYVSNKGASLIKTVRQGSCLVGCIGDIGRVGYVVMPVTFNQQINAVEWNNELVDDIFGYYALKYMEDVFKASAVSAVVPILNKTNFSNITIPIPPLSDQKKFADFVGNVWKIEAAMKNNAGESLISSLQHQSFAVN